MTQSSVAVSFLQRAAGPVSSAGWAALGLGLAALAASWVSGWAELRSIGLMLLAAVGAAVLFAVGRNRYEVALELPARRVSVGDEARATVRVRSAARRRMLPVRVEIPVGDELVTTTWPSMGPGKEHEESVILPTDRRAVVPVGPVRSVRGDSFGLVRRDVRWTGLTDLYVHPRTVALHGAAPGFLRDLEGRPSRELSSSDVAFHALRQYVPGDDRRYVHWRTSARTGRLMVRQFEETRRSHLAVVLSTSERDFADEQEFELAVSSGASFALQALREERDLSVLTSQGSLAAVTPTRLLDALAGLEVGDRAESLQQLTRRAAQQVAHASVVMLVCGSVPGVGDLRRAAALFPLDARVVAVRCVSGVEPSVRTVGSMTVVTVGELEQLGRTMREAARR